MTAIPMHGDDMTEEGKDALAKKLGWKKAATPGPTFEELKRQLAEERSAGGGHRTNSGGGASSSGGTSRYAGTPGSVGEVQNMDQIEEWLKRIIALAGSEMEDARAQADRAAQEVARFERLSASLGRLDLDDSTLAEIGQLQEFAMATKAAAERRADAAEATASDAQAALDRLLQRHGQLRQAHRDSAHAAEREFYTEGS